MSAPRFFPLDEAARRRAAIHIEHEMAEAELTPNERALSAEITDRDILIVTTAHSRDRWMAEASRLLAENKLLREVIVESMGHQHLGEVAGEDISEGEG